MGPYLTLTVDPGTKLEYWESRGGYRVFIHSAASGAVAAERDARLAAVRKMLEAEMQKELALIRDRAVADVDLAIEERVRAMYADWEKRR